MPHTGNLDPPSSSIYPLCSQGEGQLGIEKMTKSEAQRGLQPKGGSKHVGGQSLLALHGGVSQSGAELEGCLLRDRRVRGGGRDLLGCFDSRRSLDLIQEVTPARSSIR